MEKTCYIANYEHMGKVCWGNDVMRPLFKTENERLAKYPGSKYGWDSEAYTYDNLAEEDPELLKLMQETVKRWPGRVYVGACTYGQPLSCYINGESNIRQLTEAIETDMAYFDQRPYVYIMSEHAMHAQMPQILAQTGFKGAVLRTLFGMYGTCPEYDASCVRWYGLDNQAWLPAVPTYPGEFVHCAVNGYTHDRRTLEFTFFGANTIDNKILIDYPKDAPWGGLENFVARFPSIKRPIALRADDPRQPEGIIAEYAGKRGFEWVLDEEILSAAGEPEADVHSEVNDFRVRMPWGLCGNWVWEKCRRYESKLFALDMLDALREAAGLPGEQDALKTAWKSLLINQHHDIQICGLEEDAKKCFARGDAALSALEKTICGGKMRFNPLPWTRQDNGQAPLSLIEADDTVRTECYLDGLTLSTPFYHAHLSPEGGFDSVTDLRTGREVFMPGRRSGYLAGVIDGKACVSRGVWSSRTGHCTLTLTDRGEISGIPYEIDWTFSDLTPRVDCHIAFDFDSQFIGRRTEDRRDPMSAFVHDEKLRMKFCPNLPTSAMGWRDQPFAAAETNRQSIECNLWAAVTDGENGFALFNRGIQCVSREDDGGLSVPLAYAMYYIWSGYDKTIADRDAETLSAQRGGTHHEVKTKHFLTGHYDMNLAFMPFVGNWMTAQLHRRAMEYNQPCVDVSEETAQAIERMAPSITADDNVFVSSVFSREGELYLRAYEMEGREGELSMRLRNASVSLEPVDFFGRRTGEAHNKAVLEAHAVREYRLVWTVNDCKRPSFWDCAHT